MTSTDSSKNGDFANWVEGKSEALKFELGEKFPVTANELHSPSVHIETGKQNLEEVLLGHEAPGEAFLEELAALQHAPPVSDEKLARQALDAGGADDDNSTPE